MFRSFFSSSVGFDYPLGDPSQHVDQVFCAAVNIAQGPTGQGNAASPNIEQKCRLVLQAAFDGAYVSAILNKRTQLFLVPVGAGAFGNRMDWVWDAITAAHERWTGHPECTLKRVCLPMWGAGPFVRDLLVEGCVSRGWNYEWVSYTKNIPTVEMKST